MMENINIEKGDTGLQISKFRSITHVNTHDVSGGAAKVAWRLAEAQRNLGMNSKMLVGHKITDSQYTFSFPLEQNLLFTKKCKKQGLLYYNFQGSHKLIYNSLVKSADIIHLHNLHGDYFNPFSLFALSCLKPLVWTLHDMQSITGHCACPTDCEKWQTGCGKCPQLSIMPEVSYDATHQLWCDKKNIYDHSCLYIVTPSQWLKNKIAKSILKNHPIELIYNGVNTNTFRPYNKLKIRRKFDIPIDRLVIGSAAHAGVLNNDQKGGIYTQQALELLVKIFPNILFVNIGGDCEDEYPNILNIPEIHNENKLAEIYSLLDVFLNTSIVDNCPLVILEALSCGIPIVTFDTGGIPELVRDGMDGYVVPCNGVNELVSAVEKLAHQPKLRAQFGIHARQHAVMNFEHKLTVQSYLKLYDRFSELHRRKAKEIKLLPLDKLPKNFLNKSFFAVEYFSCKRRPAKKSFFKKIFFIKDIVLKKRII